MNIKDDDYYARDGAKIGDTLKIRLPNDYTVRSGPTAVPQDTVERSVPLQIASQKGVDIAFSTAQRSLSVQDYKDRFLEPMMNKLAGSVAVDLMSATEGISNLVHAVDGSNNTIAPTANTWLRSGAVLDQYGVPRTLRNRKIIIDPVTQANTVTSLAGLFNSQSKIGQQYETGEMNSGALGFDWMMDQTVILHTTGAYGTLPTVAGANQTGSAITVSALAGPLNQGDIISFAGVFNVNRTTNTSTGSLAQFAVTAPVAGGATSIPIYPALNPTAPFQTVTASPANGAAVTAATKAGEIYRKNIAMDPRALTFASADLEIPRGVHEAYRASFGGVSMRFVTFYGGLSDQMITRLDILYGWALVRPEWAVVVADAM